MNARKNEERVYRSCEGRLLAQKMLDMRKVRRSPETSPGGVTTGVYVGLSITLLGSSYAKIVM
jgi:hypothetical protein